MNKQQQQGLLIIGSLGLIVASTALLFRSIHQKNNKKTTTTSSKNEIGYDNEFDKIQDELNIELNKDDFINLLRKLISESESVQNYPPTLIPKEDNIVKHIENELESYIKKGLIDFEKISYKDGRSNIIMKYNCKNKSAKTVSFVGSHLDVVPADPTSGTWTRDPFQLIIEGDNLYGRGVTDCLGHVALITLFFKELAKNQPELNVNVAAVFIASEENDSIKGVGIDALAKNGKLDFLKNGHVLWVDSADSQPCAGTAGAIQWKLQVTGKRFHSGLPQKAINPIELGTVVLGELQNEFYKQFPITDKALDYKFATSSTLKPTQIKCSTGSLNQIPETCTILGDIRLTPFYDVQDCMNKVNNIIDNIQNNLDSLKTFGSYSKYSLPLENLSGKLNFEFLATGDVNNMAGVAVDLTSPSFHALCSSINKVKKNVKPYSINGSLPLVYSMQKQGFDLQIVGFGLSSAYHADNEYGKLSDFVDAQKILSLYISKLNKK